MTKSLIVHGLTPILNVSSMNETFTWFEKLGWQKHWEWGDPATFAAVKNGAVEIFLCLNCQGSKGRAAGFAAGDESGGGVWMSWWVESPAAVDEIYQLALRHGMTVAQPPSDRPWNVREFHLCHPDGHTFRVSAGLEEE